MCESAVEHDLQPNVSGCGTPEEKHEDHQHAGGWLRAYQFESTQQRKHNIQNKVSVCERETHSQRKGEKPKKT